MDVESHGLPTFPPVYKDKCPPLFSLGLHFGVYTVCVCTDHIGLDLFEWRLKNCQLRI